MKNSRGKSPKKGGTQSKPTRLRDELTPELRGGRELFAQGREEEALALYQRALHGDRHNIRAYILTALAYAAQFETQKACAVLQSLCQLAPNDAQLLQIAGEAYTQIRAPEQALSCFERAAALDTVMPITLVELASSYERAHRLDAAKELIERAREREPTLMDALLVKARVQRRAKDTDGAVRSLEQLIASLPEQHALVSQAYGELSTIRDAEGDYDGAMRAIEHAKRVQLAHSEELWQASERGLRSSRRMIDTLTQADFDAWHEAGKNWEPARVALLTGFPRSGTTLLEQVLDAHPEVVSAEEWNYYPQRVLPRIMKGSLPGVPLNRALNRLSEAEILAERRRFTAAAENFLGEPLSGRLHLDKNPALMLLIPAQLRLFPELALLVALRDPRDVVLSCYLRYLPLNVMSVRYLTLERTAERYALDMQCWLKMRPLLRNRWQELRYEDTVSDLPAQAKRMLSTLDLGWDAQVLDYRQRLTEKTVSSPSYAAVAEPVYTRALARYRNYEKYLEPVLPILEPYLRAFGYGSL